MLFVKNLKFGSILILVLFLSTAVYSQGWNTTVQTTIPFSNVSKADLVTNKDGNHILVAYDYYSTYYLKYYLVNSSGTVIRSNTIENQATQFANIDGDNDKIYVVYKLGNQIKTKKSTDAGQSWSNIDPIDIGNNICNHIDITFGKDDNALHVVWATQDAGSDYKTYYKRLFDDQWGNTEPVTDGSNVGGFPTVSKSQDRVHVSYNTGQSSDPSMNLGDANARDKYATNWQTPQLVFAAESFRERIHAGSSKLFDFYYKLEMGMGQYRSDLYVKERSLSGTTWSSPVLLQTSSSVYEIVSITNTYDDKAHIVYEGFNSVIYRSYNGTSWSSEYTVGTSYNSPRISSVSNDLFTTWGGNYVYYRQYDAVPLTPQNFSATTYDNHPKIT